MYFTLVGSTARRDNAASMSHLGNDVGKTGEDFVEWLCGRPFATDFLFRGQKYMTPEGETELCDILILVGDTAILIEVKTANPEHAARKTATEWIEWAKKRLDKALGQLKRGCQALLGGEVPEVENKRQGRVAIVPANIKHIECVVVIDHPTLEQWGQTPSFDVDGRTVTVFTTTHEQLQSVVQELSTPTDFVDYLRARARFFEKNEHTGTTELDILACYKADPEQFALEVEQRRKYRVPAGSWTAFAEQPQRELRERLDRPSHILDAMLDKLHEARHANLPHIEERHQRHGTTRRPSDYVDVLAELALLRRIDRRVIGKKLIEKSEKCVAQSRDRWFCSRPASKDGTAIVFLVSTAPRDDRMSRLEHLVAAAKLHTGMQRVLGIATEPVTGGYGFSVDAFMVDQDKNEFLSRLDDEDKAFLSGQFTEGALPKDREFEAG